MHDRQLSGSGAADNNLATSGETGRPAALDARLSRDCLKGCASFWRLSRCPVP
jgi:hypothetical protein